MNDWPNLEVTIRPLALAAALLLVAAAALYHLVTP